MIEVSVIIPDKDSPTVGQTLESLERQSYERGRYEVIVVGTDAPSRVRESDLVRFDRSDQPLSPAAARNRGARQARGKVLAFLDADCCAHPDWLRVLQQRFAEVGVEVLGGGVEIEGGGYWATADNLSTFHEFLANRPSGKRQQLPSLNLAVHASLFQEVGGFDERYPVPGGEDADLTARLRARGTFLHFEPRAVVQHLSSRQNLRALMRHAQQLGRYSLKVDPRHTGTPDGFPGWTLHPWVILIAAPVLATGATLKAFIGTRAPMRWWLLAPAVFLAKLAWCEGAASRLRQLPRGST